MTGNLFILQKMRPTMELDEDCGVYGTETFDEEALLRKVKNFLKRASDRWAGTIDNQQTALEIASGGFWDVNDNRKRWAMIDKHGNEIIPTIPYNNVDSQVNAIASPFSRSGFHVNVIDKTGDNERLQDAITKIESNSQAKNTYQRAFTRGVKCAAGYVVVGTVLDKDNIVPNLEFITNQAMVAFDPDCVKASGDDAEEGALISYIGIRKARRLYGEDVIPLDYPTGQPTLSFADIPAWENKVDKVQVVRYFCKESEDITDPATGMTRKTTFVRMYTVCGNKMVTEPVKMTTDMIPIVRFAGYEAYDRQYGEVFTGYVQKMLPDIEEMSLARTMQGVRMRRCSNVRIIAGKTATEGCEGYFEDFENSSALTLVYNDKSGANPPAIHTDTFATEDINSVMQQGRQSMQDISGVNLAGIDTTQRTAYEVMQQQVNSESNVQALYLHAEEACHMLGHIMLGILNNGIVPEFTLEGGPSVITSNMKTRSEIQAIADMVAPEHKELCAIRMAKTIDSPAAKGLEQDLKANCGLQLTGEQDIGTVINACEKMKQQLDQTMQQLQEVSQQNQELEKQNYELNLQMSNMKRQQDLDLLKFQAQMNKDEAQLASENMQAAKKLEQEDEKLAIQAAKDRAVQQRENARFYVDTLKNAGRRR